MYLPSSSNTDSMFSNSEWFLLCIVRVSSDEVLKQELRVSKVAGVVLERLSVASDQSLLEISRVPDPSFHVFTSEHVLSLGDEFVSSHLNILIEEITSKNLLSIFIVYQLRVEESVS